MKNILNFTDFNINESESVNENAISNLFNVVKRIFGDQKSKLDSILSEYENEEIEYANDWNKIVTDIDELQLKETEKDITPGTQRAYSRQISNKENLLKTLDNKRVKTLNYLEKKAEKIIGNDDKLGGYWGLKKSQLDAKIAKKLLDFGKRISGETYTAILKSKYEAAAKAERSAQSTFKNYFKAEDYKPEKGKSATEMTSEEIKYSDLIGMRLTDFPDAVKKMDKKQIRELIRLLKKERNETLAASDTERDKIFAKSEAMKDKSKAKDYKDEEFKKITAKYRDKISDLRSKITIAQRYD